MPQVTFGERLSPAGGISIAGIDLTGPLPPDAREAINAAILAHHIVILPGQALSRERQFAFAALFGEVERHGTGKRHGVAHVMSNFGPDGMPAIRMSPSGNHHWHTDKPYNPVPPSLTMLHAVEVPPSGGDTEFANTALAYDRLSEDTKRRLTGLRVAFRPAFDPSRPAADHPLVRTHPETGRRALYLGNHAMHIVGMDPAEGAALLGELLAHATQRHFVHAHRWRAGDLVVWDNRVLLHRLVLGDELRRYRRVMHRSLVRGTVPV